MNVLMLGGSAVYPVFPAVAEAGYKLTEMGSTLKIDAVVIAAAALPSDWYHAGMYHPNVIVYGALADPGLGEQLVSEAHSAEQVVRLLSSIKARKRNSIQQPETVSSF